MAKSARGRPSKYKPEYCEEIVKHFDLPAYNLLTTESKEGKPIQIKDPNDLPTFEKFAHIIGVTVETLHEWKRKHPEFSEAYKKAKSLQKDFLVTNGLQGHYPAAAFIFTAKNILGWRDKTEQQTTITHEFPKDIKIKVIDA